MNGRREKKARLARAVPLPLLILYALGTTIGAGIYVVIGEIIGEAGSWAPLSFLVASFVAGLTGASFAELSSRCPSSGGPVAWADFAFPGRWLAVLIGWAIVVTGILSAATIATGFVAYAGLFTNWSKYWILPVLVAVPTLVAVSGIKQSAWFMAAITAAGLFGLAIVLWNAGPNIPQWPDRIADAGPLLSSAIGGSVLIGAFLAFYAFIGFEDLAHLGEEVKAARRSIPAAIFFTLLVSLLLYVSVAAAAVTTLPVDRIAASRAPLIDVVEQAGGGGSLVATLSLMTIADGLLAQIVMVSRTVYDLGRRRKGAPRWIASLSPQTHTPVLATLLIGTAILALALMFETRALASGTSSVILLIFATANLALIVLKRRAPRPDSGFRAWGWVPYAGASSCLLLLGVQLLIGNSP